MDLDWDEEEPFGNAFVYLAMSDDLQAWAFQNDRFYLLKIGFCRDPEDRLSFLNGQRLRNSKRVRPCLNFTDWRIVGQWPMLTRASASKTEGRLKVVFDRALERFDRTELVKGYPPGNGETEIYRLPFRRLPPIWPGFFRAHGLEGRIVNQAVTVVEKAVEEIERRWSKRLILLDSCEDDPPERTSEPPSETAYRDLLEQVREDREAAERTREDGWPYGDD